MLLAVMLLVAFPVVYAEENTKNVPGAEPTVSARAAVLMDADSGRVLFAKQDSERLPMASTTKIMTSLLTLEASAVTDPVITVTDEMVRVEGSSMGLMAGNKLALSDLATGMLMVSGNDAANAAAIAVAGSVPEFAKLMNARAEEIGMKNSHFVTPSGLDAEEHYSTAYDMALLGTEALSNSRFAGIVSQKNMTVKFENPIQTIRYGNHNRLLSLYPDAIGIKTGFTKKAGRCLVSAAERDGVRLVAVTLNAPDDWDDHIRLYEYGFSALQPFRPDTAALSATVPVVGGLSDTVTVVAGIADPASVKAQDMSRIQLRVELLQFIYAPVRQGELIGSAVYLLDGETVLEVPLLAQQGVECAPLPKTRLQRLWDGIKSLFQ